MSLVNAGASLKVFFISHPKVEISSFLTVLRGKPFPNIYAPTHADIIRPPCSKSWENWPNELELTTNNGSLTTNSTIQLLDITTYGEIYPWSKETANVSIQTQSDRRMDILKTVGEKEEG